MEDLLSDVLFLNPFQKKKRRLDHESQKPVFRFEIKNPLEMNILWIYDRFWILVKKRKKNSQNLAFTIQESRHIFLIFVSKLLLSILVKF